MTMTSYFIDVSHHDWNRRGGNLDWPKVAASGVVAACVRLSYGDPEVYAPVTEHGVAMATGARAGGIGLVGGYHNLIHGDVWSMRRQAAVFTGELRAAGCVWAMLDVEPYEALKANGLWPRWDDVVRFRTVWAEDPSRPKLSFYIARWVWSDWLGKPDLTNLGGPLFNAAYPSKTRGALSTVYELAGGGEGVGWGSYGGAYPSVWQFTANGDVPGATAPTDGDAFKGTAAELGLLLAGGDSMRSANMQVLTNQTKAKYPGVTVYGVGDAAHKLSPSGHNEDDTAGSLAEDQDADTKPEHRAIDVMRGAAFSHAQAMAYVLALVTVPANQRRLLYVIYDRKIWRAKGGWKQEAYTGDDPHTNHVHVSGEADDDENTAPWILDIQQQPGGNAAMGAASIFYDGKGYGTGDGVSRMTIITWPEMVLKQAAAKAGELLLNRNGEIINTQSARSYGVLIVDAEEWQASAAELKAATAELAARVAALDNGLPEDPDALQNAIDAAIGDDVDTLKADVATLASTLAAHDNGLPEDPAALKDALMEALATVHFRAEVDAQ